MTQRQDAAISRLTDYLTESSLELLERREIDYGLQFRISDGSDVCTLNVYTSGKIVVGGKKSSLRLKLEEWNNVQWALDQAPATQEDPAGAQNRATKFVVAQAKIDDIRVSLAEMPGQITWREGDTAGAQEYMAEIRANGAKVVVTQFRTGTLMVQGRESILFDQVCDKLDSRLSQSVADRATRYIPETERQVALDHMCQPDVETTALAWLTEELGEDLFDFLYPHDRETLASGAALLQTVEAIVLPLADYSVLVMPFARAYEGFLVKLFVHLGLGDESEIGQDLRAIQIGKWLKELPKLIADQRRHGHYASELEAAWTGCRCLTMHSDPARRTAMPTLAEAQNEIKGVLLRALRRGYESFVARPIAFKGGADHRVETPGTLPKRPRDQIEIEPIDEAPLIERLEAAGHKVEYIDKESEPTKWRVLTEDWQVFWPREPANKIIVRGKGRDRFVDWFHQEESEKQTAGELPRFEAHIGVDEAGKGDYFGPLTVGAVYVTEDSALDLIRWGVRDSKDMSDSKIADLALKIRERCPHAEIVLMPPDYNKAYREHQNLNSLLAELHAQAVERLAGETGCVRVVDDQFAAPHVLEEAMARKHLTIDLEQRPGGESDIAVAAASILARESFVAAIKDFRVKAEMEIPLGSSSPKIKEVGRKIVAKWGAGALERIAKLNFRTTQKILGRR